MGEGTEQGEGERMFRGRRHGQGDRGSEAEPPATHLVLISKSSWLEWHISLKRDTKKS